MKILLVDDKPENLYLLQTMFQAKGYETVTAANGQEALDKLQAEPFDLIIADILMPVMDGFQLCKHCKGDEALRNIPFIFYTATYVDEKDEAFALKLGADRFLRKPMQPNGFLGAAQAVMEEAEARGLEPGQPAQRAEEETYKLYSQRLVQKLEQKMQDLEVELAGRKQAEENLQKAHAQLWKALEGTVKATARMVELRDPYTSGHQSRVARLARAIAGELALPEQQKKGVSLAGMIHDLGKIAVPAEILSKSVRLSDMEYSLIQNHSQTGYDILKDIDFPWPIARTVFQHHERLDGSGYPQGLSEKDILLEARIMAVADVVEAMTSHRPYRTALDLDQALEEIEQGRGIRYDPGAVDACLRLYLDKGFSFDAGSF
ncbi:MAG: response regulator [Desulfohalobiaceae bacterium]|nr:response regulator [Desulfohalobiaceae bacterium]